MGKVGVYLCENYDYEKVRETVFNIFSGSAFEQKLFTGAKVLIKTNLLMKKTPGEAVTTHPNVIRAIAEYLQSKGAKAVIGDSPAGPFSVSALKGIYKTSGIEEAAEKSGAVLNYDVTFHEVHHDKAIRLKKFDMINVVLEADFVISAAKLKTHGMMTFTGAVKNLFGVIPGLTKAEYHFKLTEKENFAYHLIDIERFIKPAFSIIDGIEGMEGNGPSNGKKRQVGLLIGGENPYETDKVASQVVSIPENLIPTLYLAEKLGYYDSDQIEIEGIDLKSLHIKPFELPESADIIFGLSKIPKPLSSFILKRLRSKPIFVHEKCISCGHCVRNCPAHIISLNSNNKPVANLEKCISCFCCHEVCPADAININKPFLVRALQKLK